MKTKHAAEERIQGQLHRAVFLVLGSEDGDEEIFRHDHQLVENEKQKQIGAEENAVATAHYQQKPEEEFVLSMFDIPRKQHRAHRRNPSDKNHGKADAIDCQMVVDAQGGNPR